MQREYVLELRNTVQQFIRAFGLLEQTRTPCGFSLSLSQVFALQELERQTLSITELADRLMLDRSSVSRLVDGLVKWGFVDRELNVNNRREVMITLTEKGAGSIQRVREQSVDFYNTILKNMPESEQNQFYESFKRFTNALIETRRGSNEASEHPSTHT